MKIKTLEQLYQAAQDRRAVTCGHIHRRPTPAAWVLAYQGRLLRDLFRAGIYLYASKNPKSKSPTMHFNCCYDRSPCGRHTDRKTTDKSKVTCLSCRASWTFNTP